MAWKKKVRKLGQCVQNLPFTKKLDGAFEHNFFFFFPYEDGNLNIPISRLNARGHRGGGMLIDALL